jgi:hypothetical protein
MKRYIRICPRCGNTYESDQQAPLCKACTDDILKCCQWLDQHLDVFDCTEVDKENFIKDFKKAMEEGV